MIDRMKISELRSGTVVLLDDDTKATITKIGHATLFETSDGPAYEVEWVVKDGPETGEKGSMIVGGNSVVAISN